MKSRMTLTCVLLLMDVCFAWTTETQTFINRANSRKEFPDIQRLVVNTTPADLVLRFEGDFEVGRRLNALSGEGESNHHHCDDKLIVTLNNEAVEDYCITVAPSDESEQLVITPSECSFKYHDKGIDVFVPLNTLKQSPVFVNGEISSTYFSDKMLAATQGSTFFSMAGGTPARVRISSLPDKPADSTLRELKATDLTPDSVVLEWKTSNRATAEVTLAVSGEPDRTEAKKYRTRHHKMTITGLSPETEHTAIVSGMDYVGQAVLSQTVKFTTGAAYTQSEQAAVWLRVQGKHIVNSAGKPFPLGGYSSYVGAYWDDEFPRYGTPALTARYFRSMGFNCCRLALVEHKEGWHAASIMNDGSAFTRYGGPAGYVKRFLAPLVRQIVDEGVYVILDWHWSYGLTNADLKNLGDFWEACAIEFRDEPRIAMYQLLNEPGFAEGDPAGHLTPDIAPRIRDLVKNWVDRIRKHDKRHIILVPDWNSGWGWATESQWGPVNFDVGDPHKQIAFSKHIGGEHATDAHMSGSVDAVVDQWDVPFLFDEVELGDLMSLEETAWFFQFLSRNPRKYGYCIWVCGQYSQELINLTTAFNQVYLPRVPFGAIGMKPIVQRQRMTNPIVTKQDNHWLCRYTLTEALEAGDYGIQIENADGARVAVAVSPRSDPDKMLGTWLGRPHNALWLDQPIGSGRSAVNGTVYFHALEPFVELVLRIDREPNKGGPTVALLRLNSRHQMPVPKINNRFVK